jgi:hypothetical protein
MLLVLIVPLELPDLLQSALGNPVINIVPDEAQVLVLPGGREQEPEEAGERVVFVEHFQQRGELLQEGVVDQLQVGGRVQD